MTCRECEPNLSAFVDGELQGAERAAVSVHVDGCARCRGLVRDLERLRAAARELGAIEPPDHVWLEVAGQIHLQAPPAPVPLVRPAARRPPLTQYLTLAAGLVVVAGGIYFADRMVTDAPAPPAAPAASTAASDPASAAAAVQSVTEHLSAALDHYDNAMSQLQALASSGETALDPEVAAALQTNLAVIDRAIAESRAALESDPQSEPARASLIDALRQKVVMLQTTVELMNEMRKGNQAGAARVVSGLGRKS
jgi:anti-sigma factor RsiW